MPRRSTVGLDDIATLDTLTAAYWRAARGHRDRPEVAEFAATLPARLASLRDQLLEARAPSGRWRTFTIRDPKVRTIVAPSFADRVLHHALMAHLAPVLDRALVDDTFACRVGKGTLAAALRAQHHARRHAWFVQIDIAGYFASIDHGHLRAVLARRFRDRAVLALCDRILAAAPGSTTRGLPIGALTSQHFANSYLDAVDRFILERLRLRGLVRYMDDLVWWCDSASEARASLTAVTDFAAAARALTVKPTARIGHSVDGLTFVGFRVMPGALLLSKRRRRRYLAARHRAEDDYRDGLIGSSELQRRYDAALAITAHASGRRWRAAELTRRPAVDA